MDLSARMDELDLTSEMRRLRIEPRPNERAFEIVPKHFGRMFATGTILLAITVIFIIALIALANILPSPDIYVFATVVLSVIYFLAIVWGLTQWYCFQFSALVFTNQRIINVDYVNIFSRRLAELDIHAVQNAFGQLDGFWGSLFNYGSLTIDRIGYEPVVAHYVPYPQIVAEQVIHFHNVVAHAGLDNVHNFLATSLSEDTTPELEETMKKAETLTLEPTEPSIRTPIGERGETITEGEEGKFKRKITFETVAEKLGETLKTISKAKKTAVNYLPPKDAFEIEATVLEDEAQPTIQKLKEEGAREIESKPEA